MGNSDSVQNIRTTSGYSNIIPTIILHHKNSNDFLKLKISVSVKVVQVHIDDFVTKHIVILLCRENKMAHISLLCSR